MRSESSIRMVLSSARTVRSWGKALENSLVCNTGLLEVRRGAGSRMRQDATVLKSPVSLASVARSHRASMFDGSRLYTFRKQYNACWL